MQGASGAESKAVCTEAGMFALRERRIHVTQDDFEMAVAKVLKKDSDKVQHTTTAIEAFFTARHLYNRASPVPFILGCVDLVCMRAGIDCTIADHLSNLCRTCRRCSSGLKWAQQGFRPLYSGSLPLDFTHAGKIAICDFCRKLFDNVCRVSSTAR
jgi:hypothetical protein